METFARGKSSLRFDVHKNSSRKVNLWATTITDCPFLGNPFEINSPFHRLSQYLFSSVITNQHNESVPSRTLRLLESDFIELRR